MTKTLLKNEDEFKILKDMWANYGTTEVDSEFNGPLEYPCVAVFSFVGCIIKLCFVYNSDFNGTTK